MKNLLVTVSGGRSSAMTARIIQTHEKYKSFNKIYVFANTGQERIETINFLKNIIKYWKIDLKIVEARCNLEMNKGVEFEVMKDLDNISMNSEPFEEVIRHKNKGVFKGLPNPEAPYCSELLKTIPCKKYADSVFGTNNYIISIGYRKEDMPKRITFAEIKEDKKRIYPLITDFDYPIGYNELTSFFEKELFQLMISSKLGNCELCWKKGDKTLYENINYSSRTIDWWRKMENETGTTSFRDNRSIDDLIREAKEQLIQTNPFDEFKEDDEDRCVCAF